MIVSTLFRIRNYTISMKLLKTFEGLKGELAIELVWFLCCCSDSGFQFYNMWICCPSRCKK